MQKPKINFYLPLEKTVSLPESSDVFWQWITETPGLKDLWSIYHLILLTYLHLKEKEFPCSLVREMPEEGIVIAHHSTIPPSLKPSHRLTIVDVMIDKGFLRYPYANFYVVMNPLQKILFSRYFYIPPWTQSSLIPRDPDRGELFENLAFVGTEKTELAEELKTGDFEKRLESLGLSWSVPQRSKWNDFSSYDAVVAIRSFGKELHKNKPALKLFNAWKAGVPAILGAESAYRLTGSKGENYLEVKSLGDLMENIKKLKNDPSLRKKLVKNGKEKLKNFTDDKIAKKWEEFFKNIVIPHHMVFCSSRRARIFFAARNIFTRCYIGLFFKIMRFKS